MRERAGTARGAVRAGWCAGVCRRPAAACATDVAHATVVGVIHGILSLHIPSLPFGIHYVTLVTPTMCAWRRARSNRISTLNGLCPSLAEVLIFRNR